METLTGDTYTITLLLLLLCLPCERGKEGDVKHK